MSTATFVECSIVIESRYGSEGIRDLDLLLSKAQVQLTSVDDEQAYVAREAFRHFGKGRHAAGLNFGDCFAYALAQSVGEPLLFEGRDFPLRDVKCHSASSSAQ
jgi:ribonuclease VapC